MKILAALLLTASTAQANYVCVARPRQVPPGQRVPLYQRHGFTRLDAERAALAACTRFTGSQDCRVTSCTPYSTAL